MVETVTTGNEKVDPYKLKLALSVKAKLINRFPNFKMLILQGHLVLCGKGKNILFGKAKRKVADCLKIICHDMALILCDVQL